MGRFILPIGEIKKIVLPNEAINIVMPIGEISESWSSCISCICISIESLLDELIITILCRRYLIHTKTHLNLLPNILIRFHPNQSFIAVTSLFNSHSYFKRRINLAQQCILQYCQCQTNIIIQNKIVGTKIYIYEQ